MTRMTGPDCAVMCNLINTQAGAGEGGGGGGGRGEAWGRGCWTARTMGGSDGNPV